MFLTRIGYGIAYFLVLIYEIIKAKQYFFNSGYLVC